jgi:hypothetical protein
MDYRIAPPRAVINRNDVMCIKIAAYVIGRSTKSAVRAAVVSEFDESALVGPTEGRYIVTMTDWKWVLSLRKYSFQLKRLTS